MRNNNQIKLKKKIYLSRTYRRLKVDRVSQNLYLFLWVIPCLFVFLYAYSKITFYLMDNSEVNMGLTNAIQLLNQVYLDNGNIQDLNNETIQVLKEKLETLITKNTESIEQQLWNSNESRYEVGLNNANEVIAFKGWDNFYPDAVAQLFPAIFEVESSNKKRNLFLYEKFCAHYEWQNFGHFDSGEANFYWPIIAYAAAIMEDEKRVKSYFINFENRTMGEHPYPVYITDSGWLIRSCEIMEKFYDKRMENLDPFDLVQ